MKNKSQGARSIGRRHCPIRPFPAMTAPLPVPGSLSPSSTQRPACARRDLSIVVISTWARTERDQRLKHASHLPGMSERVYRTCGLHLSFLSITSRIQQLLLIRFQVQHSIHPRSYASHLHPSDPSVTIRNHHHHHHARHRLHNQDLGLASPRTSPPTPPLSPLHGECYMLTTLSYRTRRP